MAILEMPLWLDRQLRSAPGSKPTVAPARPVQTVRATQLEAKIVAEQERQFVASEAKRRMALALTPLAPLRVLSLTQLMEAPAIAWHVDRIIARGTVVVVGGDGGVGKSATLLELSGCVAKGTPFLGEFPATQGRVLYVAAEGRSGYGPRLNALQKAHGLIPEDRFALVDDGLSLTSEASVTQLCNLVARDGYDLVILDTLSQLAAVESENDAAEMARVLGQAKRISDAKPGTTVIIVAHTNKASGKLRGSSAIRDNVDAVWMLRGTRDAFSLSNRAEHGGKMRDGEPLIVHGLSLVPAFGSVVVKAAVSFDEASTPAIQRVRTLANEIEDGAEYTTAELREMILKLDPGRSEATIGRTVKGLVADGILEFISKGRYRSPSTQRTGPVMT